MSSNVTAAVYNSANSTKVADLSLVDGDGQEWNLLSANYQQRSNEVGGGSVDIPSRHPSIGSCNYRNVVRISEGGTHLGSFFIRNKVDTIVPSDDSSAPSLSLSGTGTLDIFSSAVVGPWVGVGNLPSSSARVFNWASPQCRMSQFNSTIYPQTRAMSRLGWDERPIGWPDPFSQWMWTRVEPSPPTIPTYPVGDVLFRRSFTTSTHETIAIFVTADDQFEMWLDGVQIMDEKLDFPADTWWWASRAGATVPFGTHHLAIKGTNLASTGPGGVLCSVWYADPVLGMGDPILVSGDPSLGNPWIGAWYAKEYPVDAPGFTAGEIVRILVDEAKARGALSGVTLNFTDSVDSAGRGWENIAQFSTPIGSTILDVLLALSTTWVDLQMSLAGLQLNMYSKPGGGAGSASGITLQRGTNISSLVRTGSA